MEAREARDMEFLFIGDRKREPVMSILIDRNDDAYSAANWEFRNAAVRLARMLRLSQKTLSNFLPKDPQSFYFNSPPLVTAKGNEENAEHETSF